MVKVSTSCSLKMVNVTEFKFCTLTPLYDIYMVVCYEEDWRLSWQKVIELTWLYPSLKSLNESQQDATMIRWLHVCDICV